VNQQNKIRTKFLDLYKKQLSIVVHESIDCTTEADGYYAIGFRINQEQYEGHDFFITPNDNVLYRKIDGFFSNLKEAIKLFPSKQEATNFAAGFHAREYPPARRVFDL